MNSLIQSTTFPFQAERMARAIKLCMYVLACLFFLNCFTPLRLHYDMMRYFSIKDCIESVCPPYADPHDYLPYGYTGLLLLLSKLGILKSFTLVFVNCLYLFGGLYFVRKVFSYIRQPYFLFILVLLNWTVIKYVVHPLSELQYLFFSLASIYSFYKFIRLKNIWNLLLAFLMAGLAFLTRTVGITLVAALLVSLIWEYRKQLVNIIKSNKIIVLIFVVLIAAVLIFSKQLGFAKYTGVMSKQFNDGLRLSDVIGWHFSEWAEILVNTSRFKIISMLPSPMGVYLLILIGLLGVGGFIYICFLKKNQVPFIVKSYLFFYILLIFNWPFQDPRFWVPVIPLIAAVISQTSFSRPRIVKYISIAYLFVYAILGIASLGFITYTSFNKKEFAKTEAKGDYKNEYEIHFFGKPLSDTARHIDPNIVDFLNKYDR